MGINIIKKKNLDIRLVIVYNLYSYYNENYRNA